MIVYGQISCICLHANEGHESKMKDMVFTIHLTLRCKFTFQVTPCSQGRFI